jgi:FtsZ-binding cell division protein ZapB
MNTRPQMRLVNEEHGLNVVIPPHVEPIIHGLVATIESLQKELQEWKDDHERLRQKHNTKADRGNDLITENRHLRQLLQAATGVPAVYLIGEHVRAMEAGWHEHRGAAEERERLAEEARERRHREKMAGVERLSRPRKIKRGADGRMESLE